MKTDYSELAGEEVNYVYINGSETLGFVVNAIYKKGITIVRYDDENHFLICLNYNGKTKSGSRSYREIFYYLIKQIKNGQINYGNLFKFSRYKEESNSNPTASSCAFR